MVCAIFGETIKTNKGIMNKRELIENLKRIENVDVSSKLNVVYVTTFLHECTAIIDCNEVLFSEFITSPRGENCLQIFCSDGGGIIVTPTDFVFNVEQDEFVRVENLPPMCSIREMSVGFDTYRRNPNPTKNFDKDLGLFYLHYYIMKSALSKGFNVEFITELYDIGLKNGFLLDKNETLELFKELGTAQPEVVNELAQMWNGYCPESHLYGKTVRMRLNSYDFFESEQTGLQIAVLRGVQAIILNFRGEGKFRTTPSYADEIENGEMLSPQNSDNPPFNYPTTIFGNSKEIEDYIKSVR